MPITLRPSNPQIILRKIEEPQTTILSASKATVRLYPKAGDTIALQGLSGAAVSLIQVPEPPTPRIVLNNATAPAVSVVLGIRGPKGDNGTGGDAGNVFQRVSTAISGIWGATFYVQDATANGDWIITRIDGSGNATTASSDDSEHAALSTEQAWTSRLSLTYAT